MGKKSKYKWYAIWTVYCILVIPFGIIIHYCPVKVDK